MSDIERPNESQIIAAWLIEYGEIRTYKKGHLKGVEYRKIPIEVMSYSLNALLQSMIAAGIDKDIITSHATTRKMITAVLPPDEKIKKDKLMKWRATWAAGWESQLREEYEKNADLIKTSKDRPNTPPRPPPKPDPEDAPVWTPPSSGTNPKTFKGLVPTKAVYDEEFIKTLEGLKDGE